MINESYLNYKTLNENLKIVKDLKKILRLRFGDNIEDVILFGSRASDNASTDSDYDVLVILRNDYDWHDRNDIISEVYKLEVEMDILFDIHLLSSKEMKDTLRGAQPVFINAINKGLYA